MDRIDAYDKSPLEAIEVPPREGWSLEEIKDERGPIKSVKNIETGKIFI